MFSFEFLAEKVLYASNSLYIEVVEKIYLYLNVSEKACVVDVSMIYILFIIVSGTYFAAVIENRSDFIGRVVVDVGAGSGILSLFAAQVT